MPQGKRLGRSGLRAVIDANVWIAGAIRPDSFERRVYVLAASGAFQSITCEATLSELKDTYTSPQLTRRVNLPLPELNELIRLLTVDGEFLTDPRSRAALPRSQG
jgi:predicted nucleic acid-binding protein